MLSALPEPGILLDPEGGLVACNAAAAGIAQALAAEARRAAHAPAAGGRARVRIAQGGQARWFELSTAPLDDGGLTLALARECTMEQNLRDALIESRLRFRDLVEMSSDFAWETDAAGAFVFVNPQRVLGFAANGMIGRRPAEFMIDPQTAGAPLPFDSAEPVDGTEFWALDAERRPRCLTAVARPIFDAEGRRTGVRGMCRDVTEERLREADLAQALQAASVLGHILAAMREAIEPKAILESACAAIVPALSAAGCRLYRARDDGTLWRCAGVGLLPAGVDDDGMAASDPHSLAGGSIAVIAADARYRRFVNGRIVLWRQADAPDWSPADRALLAKVSDQLGVALAEIAERETLERLSATDPLTELLNRRAFAERLRQHVTRAAADKRAGALIYVDLDNFKQINDRAGHDRGDAALKAVAALLQRTARPTDLVARMGGDEFALWLADADERGAKSRATRLIADAAELRRFDVDPARPLGLSLGVAVFDPSSGETAEALIGRADGAMYRGKHGGKGRVVMALAFGVEPGRAA
ncbi:MAG: diguanylate cyclase [Alphaproteobacteria bacterium]|nr:diguanylate cyclase [Alphaproteobacteria bacterium]